MRNPIGRRRTGRPLHPSPGTSLAMVSVAAVVIASPLAVLVGESATDAVKHQAPGAIVPTKTVINSVSLNELPTMALDLVRSGLAQAGVTLPPIDVSGIQLPDIPIQVPPGLIPPGLLPSEAPATTTPAVPTPPIPAPTQAAGTPGAPAGATDVAIKEITQSKPFSMIALTWDGLTDTTAFVRAKQPNGQWGQWFSTDGTDGNASHRANTQGTEPIWVGNTTAVQVAVTKKGQGEPVAPAAPGPASGNAVPSATPQAPAMPVAPAPSLPTVSAAPGQIKQQAFTARQEPPAVPDPAVPDPAAPTAPAPTSGSPAPTAGGGVMQTVVNTLKAILIAPGTSPGDGLLGSLSHPGTGGKPQIISREQWGADESMRCSQPTYDQQLKAAVVHHSAGSNDYTPAQSAEIVRGIYAYHAQTLDWCDIGYNAVVDKYGQIFEGAYGGLDKNVEGTHTGGFNPDTVGVVMLGNLNDVPPTPAQIESVGRFLGWRLGLAQLDPLGTATLVSQGFDGSQYGAGETVTKPVIAGHRDYDETDCPGNFGYQALDQIRQVAAGKLTLPMQPSPSDPDGTQNNLVDNSSTPPSGTDGVVPTDAPPNPATQSAGAPAGPVLAPTDAGAIAAKWVELGGPTGKLGRALSAETVTPDGKAKYTNFQNGLVYWSATTGAQVIWGLIEKAWAALGFENSSLGLPTGGETITGNLVSQAFQFGKLIFNTSTGIVSQVVQTYLNELQKNLQNPAAPAPAGAPVPAPTPAAAPAPAPAAAPAPVAPSVPAR